MRIQPDSTVNLYGGVDIDVTSGVEIAFKTIANQRAYFASKLVRANTPCTMIKKTGYVRLEVPGTVVKNCNYISFTNPSFDNKTFYGLITDYNYINNECVEISYVLDWWQSYMFDVSYERMGIERQGLNVTDWNKAEANPYDPSIYAFQTSEGLPFNDGLEPREYDYVMSSVDGEDAMFSTDGIQSDGAYAMMATSYTQGDEAVDQQYTGFSYMLILAPIDFEYLQEYADENWENMLNRIASHRYGRVCPANSQCFYGTTVGNTDEVNRNTSYKSQTKHYLWSTLTCPCDILVIPQAAYGTIFGEQRNLMDAIMETLTKSNAISQIVGIYKIPYYMVSCLGATRVDYGGSYDINFDGDDIIKVPTSYQKMNSNSYQHYVPACKKLMLHPYSYIRVTNPSSEIKEYKYEDFVDVAAGNASSKPISFRTCVVVNGTPLPMIIPRKYKENRKYPATAVVASDLHDGSSSYSVTVTPELACEFNIDERMEIKGIPAVAYVTDSWLTHLSSTYMNAVAVDDHWRQKERQEAFRAYDKSQTGSSLGIVGDIITGGLNIAGNIIGGMASILKGGNEGVNGINMTNGTFGGGIGIFSSGMNSMANMHAQTAGMMGVTREQQLNDGFNDFMVHGADAEQVSKLSDTKPAFANNNYHPGSFGDPMYTIGNTLIDFKITQVRLRDAILQKYDEYFKTYGYNFSSVVDIPYLMKYTQNASSNDDLPHWELVNGKYSTYIKTVDAHVTHAMLPVCQALESMFNGGVRMLRGEDLYV